VYRVLILEKTGPGFNLAHANLIPMLTKHEVTTLPYADLVAVCSSSKVNLSL
jgi:hypothetical protein